MKLTKYPQSCVVVTLDGVRLLIDPGSYAMDAHGVRDFGDIDAVLYTHRHGDHFDQRLLDGLERREVRFVTNADVAPLLSDRDVTVLADGQNTEVGGVQISAHDMPHCPMVDGTPGPPNTGYLIDNRFLHPGDAAETAFRVEALALPIAGPSISFGSAYKLVEATGAAKVVPIHYDAFVARPEQFAGSCKIAEVIVLGDGESTEL